MDQLTSAASALRRDAFCQTGLLVSVRSLEEANLVAEMGLAILDLKEPSAGPLAPVAASVWREVAKAWGERTVLSAAMGEFSDAIEIADAVPPAFSFAKMGPAGCESTDLLCQRWTAVRGRLPRNVELVAVAYADHEAANCPPPHEVFAAALESKMHTWLVDTFEKRGKSTIDQLSIEHLSAISKLAIDSRSTWAIAGSLKLAALAYLRTAQLTPHWIGVRGDVCDHARTGRLSKLRVQDWLDALS